MYIYNYFLIKAGIEVEIRQIVAQLQLYWLSGE